MWVQSNADHNWEKTESDYSNPIGLLSDCYRRIERFLNVKILVTNRARGAELTKCWTGNARRRSINLNALESNLRILAPRKKNDLIISTSR